MKKIGQFLLCAVPMLCMLIINVGVTMAAMFVEIAKYIAGGTFTVEGYTEYVMALTTDTDFLLTATLAYQAVAFIAAILIYYFVFKEKKPENPGRVYGKTGWIYIILLFVGCEFLITVGMFGAEMVFPDVMEAYAEYVESSGLSEMSVLSTIATLVMAPLAEEIVFRGMTFKLARKLTKNFWIANAVQALMFGIAHLNLVQGVYAFLLGMVLGFIYAKFNSLWASILAHLTFNFAGTYLVALMFPGDEVETLAIVLTLVAALILIAGGLTLINKDSHISERYEMFKAKYEAEGLKINDKDT